MDEPLWLLVLKIDLLGAEIKRMIFRKGSALLAMALATKWFPRDGRLGRGR